MQFPTLQFEKKLWRKGYQRIAGIDEAGRGAWAGPVCAAAVILPRRPGLLNDLAGVRDSKQMTPCQRTVWADRIKQYACAWSIASASHAEIDELGIVPATRLAMRRSVQQLCVVPDHLLIDAVCLGELDLPQLSIIHGDCLSLCIASASVLAKTWRDAWMENAAEEYPRYFFQLHKGYGTLRHRQALLRHGLCAIHRRSYQPCQRLETGASSD